MKKRCKDLICMQERLRELLAKQRIEQQHLQDLTQKQVQAAEKCRNLALKVQNMQKDVHNQALKLEDANAVEAALKDIDDDGIVAMHAILDVDDATSDLPGEVRSGLYFTGSEQLPYASH